MKLPRQYQLSHNHTRMQSNSVMNACREANKVNFEAQHQPHYLVVMQVQMLLTSLCFKYDTININMANESLADSSNLTQEELNSLSQEYSLVPDDPRLRLPWDFSNFSQDRSRRKVAAAVVQLSTSTAWFRRSGGQIRIFDGDFGDRSCTYWPGESSSEFGFPDWSLEAVTNECIGDVNSVKRIWGMN